MIKRLFYFLLPALICACNDNATYTKAEDAQDAGREFIRACLDGNYDKAKFYLLKNEDNLMMLDRWKDFHSSYPPEAVRAFKESNIRPIDIKAVNDSTTLYKYSNSYTKDTTTLTVVRVNGEWLVDLKALIGN